MRPGCGQHLRIRAADACLARLRESVLRRRPGAACLQVASWWGPGWRQGSHDTQLINTDDRIEQVRGRVCGFVYAPYPHKDSRNGRVCLQRSASCGDDVNALREVAGAAVPTQVLWIAPLPSSEGGTLRYDAAYFGYALLVPLRQVIREIEATSSPVRVAFHLEPYEGGWVGGCRLRVGAGVAGLGPRVLLHTYTRAHRVILICLFPPAPSRPESGRTKQTVHEDLTYLSHKYKDSSAVARVNGAAHDPHPCRLLAPACLLHPPLCFTRADSAKNCL